MPPVRAWQGWPRHPCRPRTAAAARCPGRSLFGLHAAVRLQPSPSSLLPSLRLQPQRPLSSRAPHTEAVPVGGWEGPIRRAPEGRPQRVSGRGKAAGVSILGPAPLRRGGLCGSPRKTGSVSAPRAPAPSSHSAWERGVLRGKGRALGLEIAKRGQK